MNFWMWMSMWIVVLKIFPKIFKMMDVVFTRLPTILHCKQCLTLLSCVTMCYNVLPFKTSFCKEIENLPLLLMLATFKFTFRFCSTMPLLLFLGNWLLSMLTIFTKTFFGWRIMILRRRHNPNEKINQTCKVSLNFELICKKIYLIIPGRTRNVWIFLRRFIHKYFQCVCSLWFYNIK